jgi:phenylacetic acid degradation operon negative regulatory protein
LTEFGDRCNERTVNISARTFVLDLLMTLRDGSMPVRGLVDAGRLFGIAENSTRVALARLLAVGRIERDERGQYRLGNQSRAVRRQVESWRSIERRTVTWDGSWIGVLANNTPRPTRRARQLHERALRFLGFRHLDATLSVRPNNLRGGVAQVRDDLMSLGLSSAAAVCEIRALDAMREASARQLWDGAALAAGYRESLRTIAQSATRLPRMAVADGMRESFTLGGGVIRQLVLDPLLPEPLAPAALRDQLVEAMRAYDRIGRDCWAQFMRGLGVPHRQAPRDSRFGAQRHHLITAVSGGLA